MTSDRSQDHQQQRWRAISRHLDEALELPQGQRDAWLDELDRREPDMAAEVRMLLAERDGLDAQPLLHDHRTAALPRQGLAGQQLGAYTLDSILGVGGMGTVWLAHRNDGRYEGRAAVKLLNAALLGRPAEQRFAREGSVLAKLRHPNIAQLIDAGVAPSGQPYLVLEYIEGERIDRYMQQHQLDVNARVRLFLDVLAAISHAHSHLIVHRDIKPTNILVTRDGTVKLLDFGIAALLGPADTSLTREFEAALTPEYAAPEQLLKQPVTTATDVYALGIVLFVLLAGEHPLALNGKTFTEVARATLDDEIPRPSQRAAHVGLSRSLRGDLDNIVGKALKKDPAERYQTADALAEDLRRFLACQPVSARPDSLMYRAGKFARRHRGSVAASVLTALVLATATIVTTLQMLEARRQRDAAIYQSRRAEFQARFAYQIMTEVGGDGESVTVRQLMEKGIEVLEANYRDDPRFVIGMLVNIAGRYMDMGDTNGEYAALVKAERLAREIDDPERIAYVQCNTVETELAAGRLVQARARMQDGLAHLARLAEPSFDRQTECTTAQARLLWAEGRLPEAIDAASAVASLLEQRNETSDLLYQTLGSMLEVMLSQEGRRHEAREWNRKRIEVIERTEGDTTLSMINARHHQAGYLHDAGEVRAAHDIGRAIIDQLEGQRDILAAYSHRIGLYQVLVEESDAGMAWLNLAVASAQSRNNRRQHLAALLARAQASLSLDRFDRVQPDIEEALMLARDNPREHYASIRSARLLQAELDARRGASARALAQIDGMLAEIGYPKTRVANQLAQMVMLKAQLELALGRNGQALALANDALALARANAPQPDSSAHVGNALMTLARAQLANGDASGARASARAAASALSIGLGPDHSATRDAAAFEAD